MRGFLAAVTASLLIVPGASYANQQEDSAGEAFSPRDSVVTTDIGTLLDNEKTKSVLDRHIPSFSANPQIAMARAMTLKQIQSFASDMLTDEILTKIDADLAMIK